MGCIARGVLYGHKQQFWSIIRSSINIVRPRAIPSGGGTVTFTPTDEQRAIIAHDCSHHARVLAGPGAGKSTTMVALLDRLLSEDEDLRVRC